VNIVRRICILACTIFAPILGSAPVAASPLDMPLPGATQPVVQREVRIVARRFAFEPKTITVQRGESVRLVVTSQDVAHGIAINELNIDQRVEAGQTKVVEFRPEQEGRFRIYCSVFCGDGHPDMEGEMIVTAGPAESDVQFSFDPSSPTVAYVEAGGVRYRIDTATKSVTRVGLSATSQPVRATSRQETTAVVSQPYDYRLVNVPTPKRVPRNSLNLHFTHRFTEPINDEGLEDLFGLDGFSVSSLGISYGITDRLYASFYRSPICDREALCKTIEIGLGYHLLDEAGRSPIALSAYASAEGEDNFTENFTFNIQAMLARSAGQYVNLFFSPAVHINSNSNGRFNSRNPLAAGLELGQHTGSFGFGTNVRIRPTTSLLFEYTPRVGFKLGQIEPVDPTGTRFRNHSEAEIGLGIEKRIGRHTFTLTFSNTQTTTTARYNSSSLALPPSKFVIGFNLFRRLF
jgi:cytochrome c oxidase subunit 2